MIDDSDGDFALLASSGMGPIGGLIFVVLAIVLYVVAHNNEKTCVEHKCGHGVAKLLDHACVCVEPVK